MDAHMTVLDAQIAAKDIQIKVLITQTKCQDIALETIKSSFAWQFTTNFQKKFKELKNFIRNLALLKP
jgi:hypothetical protein